MEMRRNPHIIVQRNSGGAIVMYNPETGDLHSTNEIGYLVFILCEYYTPEDISTHIHILTGEDPQKIAKDVHTFIKELASHGYLLMTTGDY